MFVMVHALVTEGKVYVRHLARAVLVRSIHANQNPLYHPSIPAHTILWRNRICRTISWCQAFPCCLVGGSSRCFGKVTGVPTQAGPPTKTMNGRPFNQCRSSSHCYPVMFSGPVRKSSSGPRNQKKAIVGQCCPNTTTFSDGR